MMEVDYHETGRGSKIFGIPFHDVFGNGFANAEHRTSAGYWFWWIAGYLKQESYPQSAERGHSLRPYAPLQHCWRKLLHC